MHPRPVSAVSFAALLVLSTALSQAAEVKFEEQLLVEDVTNATVTISPHGTHVAAVIPKGSKKAVVVDGVEGPRFDAIATPSLFTHRGTGGKTQQIQQSNFGTRSVVGPQLSGLSGPSHILFNEQGTHCAYAGRKGDEHAIMLDGKEVHRGPYSGVRSLSFSPDGERLAAVVTDTAGAQDRVVIDGQPGPWSGSGTMGDICFTPDGKHYAYIGTQPDGSQTKWMVVDGKQVKYLGELVGFTPQGFLLTRQDSMAGVTLLGNGKPMTLVGSLAYVAISPVSGKLIMQVKPPLGTPPRDKPSMITVDGKILPGTEEANIMGSWFSPDGKRYAVLCQRYTPSAATFMIVDGKKEESYSSIYTSEPFIPSFSPDSTKFVYVAQANAGTFVVENGEESDGMQTLSLPPTWSPGGSRLAWGGTNSVGKRVFNLDGKMVALPPNAEPGASFNFTADGAHYSWSYGGPRSLTMIVDGKPLPEVVADGFVGAETFDGRYTTLKISPDGKHTAHVGRDPKNLARAGMWVDGKFITTSIVPQVNRATFTPDSQHVFWAIAGNKNERQVYRIFVDGREVLAYHSSMAEGAFGTWEMGPDGTLTFLGRDGDAFKRFRIPPPADSSISTMLAAAAAAK